MSSIGASDSVKMISDAVPNTLLIAALLIPALLIPALCGRYAMRTPGMNIAAYHESAFQK